MKLRFRTFALILTLGILTTSCIDYSTRGVFKAIKDDNVNQLKKIAEKVNLDTCRYDHELNPLLYALSNCSEKCAFYIISNSKDLSFKDSEKNDAVFYALTSDCSSQNALLDSLFQKGQDPNQKHPTGGYSMLEVATEKNDTALLQIFLKHGADINLKSALNSTPLNHAIGVGKNNAARYLINKGSNLYAESDYGNDALEIAITHDNYEIFVELYEKHQMPVNEKIKDEAISHSNTKFVQYLIDNNKISKQEIKEALFLAENTDVLKILLNKVDDINHISKKHGINLLHYACINGDTAMIKYLIDQHADINKVCSKRGYTPLMYAATCYDGTPPSSFNSTYNSIFNSTNNSSLSSSMSKMGLSFTKTAKIELCFSETKNKETSLASVKLLAEAGANIKYLCKGKYTASEIAGSTGNLPVVKYLDNLEK